MAKTAKNDDLLSEGKKAFERCSSYESENRQTALDDIRFSRLSEQWPSDIKSKREQSLRPCLTINKMPAFIRQVVNDARQNKPAIKVHPVDGGADVATADVINGLIRNIEYTSNADVAYDTAIEASVAGGFGYWRVGLDYATEDSFDFDLSIERVANQFSVYGDPNSTAADSSDWCVAFVVDRMPRKEFARKFKGKTNIEDDAVTVDFDNDAWDDAGDWIDQETVQIAEWWRREEIDAEIVKLSNGTICSPEDLEQDTDLQILIESGAIEIVGRRKTRKYKVTQTFMTGADILEVKEWPGRYIPIVPVYGDEIVVEGKRYFRSLVHNAKDAQRMFNYWRTTSTELVALSPRAPWIGRKGTFANDAERWATANTENHSYLEYDLEAPIRQPLDVGPAAGALQEALNASDDMKAIVGIYDASLGARSNETSGRAILARQKEGDVATFHFIDNLSRAIRHTGRILIDLIPKVYSSERIIRVIGEDGSQEPKPINQEFPAMDPETGEPQQEQAMDPNTGQPMVDPAGEPIMQAVMAIHDLTAGKYDLTVTTGPSFSTRREEAAFQMTEFVRAYPPAAPVMGDLIAKNSDWPGADEVAERLAKINPAAQQQIPPEVQQALQQSQQMFEQASQQIQQLQQQLEAMKHDKSIDQYNAETKRMQVEGDLDNDRAKIQADMAKAYDAGQRPTYPMRQG